MRYLANAVIHCDTLYRNSVVSIEHDCQVHITPFDGEQHSTSYVSGIILVARRDAVDEQLSRRLLAMTRHADLLDRAIRQVRHYAATHHLYASLHTDTPTLILLPRR